MKAFYTILFLCLGAVANAQQIPIPFGSYYTGYNPAITSWNPFDKNPNIILSSAFLKATSALVSGYQMVRCNKVCSTGVKQYFEVKVGAAGFDLYVGFDNGSGSLSAQPGSGSNAVSYYTSLGEIRVNGTGVQYGLATATTGDIIDILYDGNITVTFYKNHTIIGTAQTVTGGNYYPMVGRGSGVNATSSTANFGATTPIYTYATYTLGPP